MIRRFLRDAAGQIGGRLDLMAVMITVIAAGVTGYVGIDVMNTTEENTGVNSTAGSGDTFGASMRNLTDGVESFFGQLGTVFTVIILVVVLSYLMLLRGR